MLMLESKSLNWIKFDKLSITQCSSSVIQFEVLRQAPAARVELFVWHQAADWDFHGFLVVQVVEKKCLKGTR